MNLGLDNSSDSGNPGSREAAFWSKYHRLLDEAGIPEIRRPWFQRDCERFIVWLQPARIRQAEMKDLIGYLAYLEGSGLERWQLEQAHEALRMLYQKLLNLPWARDWPSIESVGGIPESESIQAGLEIFWSRQGKKEAFEQAQRRFRAEIEKMIRSFRFKH